MDLKLSALDFANKAQNGDISVEDFVASTLERIHKIDEKLHAFLSVNEDAIIQAREIDKKIKSGQNVGRLFWYANIYQR